MGMRAKLPLRAVTLRAVPAAGLSILSALLAVGFWSVAIFGCGKILDLYPVLPVYPPDDAAAPRDVAVDMPPDSADDGSPKPLTPSGPVVIDAQDGGLIEGLQITSDAGDCVTLNNSSNVTIRASEIGPCAGNAVVISGGSSITLADNYIHSERYPASCCDTGDGIFASNTAMLTVEGNVVAFGESNVVLESTNVANITGNFLLNPLNDGVLKGGYNVRVTGSQSVALTDNYTLASVDSVYPFPENQQNSFDFSLSNVVSANGNYVTGGHNVSGCGIIANDGANSATFQNNKLVDTGQCGISIASGTNQTVDSNDVLNSNPVVGGGNDGITVWNQYAGTPCGPVALTDNVSSALQFNGPDGGTTDTGGFWNGGGCTPLTVNGSNLFDAPARASLLAQMLKPPLIPPGPARCLAPSPYNSQVGWAPCAATP
jgi:hypothetical protein